MRTLVDSTDVEPKDVRGLYVIWFEVEMNMLLARRGDVGEANQFLREWSAKVGNSMKGGADVDALEQHFISPLSLAERQIHSTSFSRLT